MIARETVWLVLLPLRRGHDGQIAGIEIDRMLKNKPRVGVREVALQLTIEVDSDVFQTPEPAVTVRVDDKRALVLPEVDVEIQPEPEDPEADLRADLS